MNFWVVVQNFSILWALKFYWQNLEIIGRILSRFEVASPTFCQNIYHLQQRQTKLVDMDKNNKHNKTKTKEHAQLGWKYLINFSEECGEVVGSQCGTNSRFSSGTWHQRLWVGLFWIINLFRSPTLYALYVQPKVHMLIQSKLFQHVSQSFVENNLTYIIENKWKLA